MEFLGNQATDLLSLQVVGVVVAVGKHVRSDHDAALGFRTEALVAGLLDHVHDVRVVGGAMTVANAVEAGQVGAGFGTGHDVVDGHAELGHRQLDVDDFGTEAAVRFDSLFNGGAEFRIEPLAEPLARHTDSKAGDAVVEVTLEVLGGHVDGRGVLGVEADHAAEHPCAVLGRMTEKTSRVERGGEGNHAETGRTAVRGLHAGHTGEAGRLADGATRVGACDDGRETCGHGARGAAGGAARNGVRVPGIEDLAVGGVFIARAHGKLVAVELAEADHALVLELAHDRSVKGTHVALEHAAGGGGGPFARYEDVLVGDGNAGERRGRSRGNALVGLTSLLERGFRTDVEESVEILVGFNAGQIVLGEFDRRNFTGGQHSGQFGHRSESNVLFHFLLVRLFNDLGDQETAFGLLRCVLHVFAAVHLFRDDVVTQTLNAVVRIGHRSDARRIHGADAFYHLENIVEFALTDPGLLIRNVDTAKVGNAANVVHRKGHSRASLMRFKFEDGIQFPPRIFLSFETLKHKRAKLANLIHTPAGDQLVYH